MHHGWMKECVAVLGKKYVVIRDGKRERKFVFYGVSC